MVACVGWLLFSSGQVPRYQGNEQGIFQNATAVGCSLECTPKMRHGNKGHFS
jgi:hypothetical protein